jgi:hypothetical protein
VVAASPSQQSDQELSNRIGDVLYGTHDGVSTAYNPNDRKVNITNTDKGSVAVASHEAASDPHPQYETAAEVNSKIATHSAATDPHGDRAYTDSQLSAHASASDPHTHLNASNLTSGTVPAARLSGSYNINITGSAPWGSITGKPTTISGYGITDAQPLDSDLTAIAEMTGFGLIARTAEGVVAHRGLVVSGVGLSVSNANGVPGNPTITSNATSANNASTIVARDASGNFSAGTITASLTGAASLNVLKAGDTMTGSLTINQADQQLVIRRSNDQYLVIENNGTTTTPVFTSYSPPNNAKRVVFRSTTDGSNTPLTSGSLGFNFNTYSSTVFQINEGGINWTGTASGNGSSINNLNASNLASGTVPSGRLSGSYTINITGTASNNVLKAGDTMTGSLTIRATESTGFSRLVSGTASATGYVAFHAANDVRQGYIGFSTTTASADTGDIPYVAGSHTFTGQIRAASGSVSAPGLSFSGDTDTGVFRPAADTVALATNGVERFRIRADGTATFEQNLGLNTSSPTKALDINSDSFRLRTAKTPASATAAGETGEICWDANYLYICIATNTWRRIAHATW